MRTRTKLGLLVGVALGASAVPPATSQTGEPALSVQAVQARAKLEAAVKYGGTVDGGGRACADCATPNMALGNIGTDVYGYFQSGDCGVEGKWYASFNGYADQVYHFDLCPSPPGAGSASEDVDLKICDSSCTILAGVDGLSTCSPVSWLPNDFQWACPRDGVYYVVIAPYNSYNSFTCLGTAATTFTLNYYSELNPCEGNFPPNDTCESLPAYYGGAIPTLTPGVPYSFTGDNTCAQADCTEFPGNNAWEAFTLAGSPTGWDITLKYCMTSPAFGNAWLNLMLACPCDGFTVAGTYDTTTCGDGNVTIRWVGLADGTYYYPVLTDPANNAEGPYVITILATVHVPTYCAASGGCDEFISRVQVGTIDNATACSGYADYTALSTDMQVGTGYPITVTNGNPIYSTDQCLVWVDWNRDLDFADAGETFTMAGSPGYGPYTGTITPPPGTTAGATRMRIRINYAAVPPACGTTTYGEVEDYTVNVLPPPPIGACCVGASCSILSGDDCAAAYGIYHGDGSICTLNPCVGACCFLDGSCTEVTGGAAGCVGGTYSGDGTTCTPNTCPAGNDSCAGAMQIGEVSYLPWTTVGMTFDGPGLCMTSANIWFCYTASCDGNVTFSLCGSSYDTKLAVYDGCTCPPTTMLGCNDDSCGLQSQLGLPVVAGHQYLIEVGGYSTYSGAGVLSVSCAPPATNEPCSGAIAIGVVTNLPFSTIGMTHDGTGTCMSSANIWYCYTASCTGSATISLCGSAYDTMLAVYDGCTCNPLGPQLGCNDDYCNFQSQLTVPVLGGHQYLIEIGGYSSSTGNGVLTTSCLQAPQGACCLLTGCIIDYQLACQAAGGAYVGDNTQCGGADCNGNGIDDACDIANGTSHDCNNNGIPDECDIVSGTSQDVDQNGIPDECDMDCNANGVPDACELPGGCATGNCGTVYSDICGTGGDCQPDGVLDECQSIGDCNNNGIPDPCDVWPFCEGGGCSADCNHNWIPDECETDCNANGIPDDCDLAGGYSLDCNGNGIPDECEVPPLGNHDCNANGIPDDCDLADGTSRDCNGNNIPDECDIANGGCDCQADGIPDECQLIAPCLRTFRQYDDGTSEDSLGNGSYAHEICWIHHFSMANSGTVDVVQTTFGTPAYPGDSGVVEGTPIRVFVWADPNGDGNPIDAVLLTQEYANVEAASIDTDLFQTIAIPETIVPSSLSFFVGVSVVSSGGFAAPMDENGTLAHQSWGCYSTTGTFDPNNLGPTLFNNDAVGYPANWLLRVNISCSPWYNDWNYNGIPDECDIGVEWGGLCDQPCGPCCPPECSSDWNHNGIPDDAEMCGDLNHDTLVDIDDFYIFLDAFGTCAGDFKYNAAADMDLDGCVTLADYSAWRACYRMANGKAFVPPQPKPVPARAPKTPDAGAT